MAMGGGLSGIGGSSLAAVAGSAAVSAIPAAQASGARASPGGGPGGPGTGFGGAPRRFDEDVELPLIKVVVLGAAGVGKTALVKVRKMGFNRFVSGGRWGATYYFCLEHHRPQLFFLQRYGSTLCR